MRERDVCQKKNMENKDKKNNLFFIVLICIWLIGPFIIGTVLLVTDHVVGGVLVYVIPYGCLVGLTLWKKKKQKNEFYKIKDGSKRFDIVPVSDPETIRALYDDSALAFFVEEIDPELLNRLYNWLNNEGVLKSERLNLYTFCGQNLKNAFGESTRIRSEEKLISIFLKDLDINDSNKKQFSQDRLQIGGRWLDDIVENGKEGRKRLS